MRGPLTEDGREGAVEKGGAAAGARWLVVQPQQLAGAKGGTYVYVEVDALWLGWSGGATFVKGVSRDRSAMSSLACAASQIATSRSMAPLLRVGHFPAE